MICRKWKTESYDKGNCEHWNDVELMDEHHEIVKDNNIKVTQYYLCNCGIRGTKIYTIPSQINWSVE
jgi:hypothetical protein